MPLVQLGSGAETLRVQTHGDGLVVDLRRGGLDASVEVAAFLGQGFADLVGYWDGLASDHLGFAGVRRWESAEGELMLEASHELGRLQLRVVMRVPGPGWGDDGWTASAHLAVAADGLERFAAQLRALLSP